MTNRHAFQWTIGLAFFVSLAAVGALADNAVPSAEQTAKTAQPKATAPDSLVASGADTVRTPAPSQHRVIAYYFHGNVRCVSCRKIEAYTKEAIDSTFAQALKSGQLEWQVINVDSSQNEHFLQDYKLFTKSVVLSDLHDGKQARWKNLDKVWELLGNQSKFHAYIQEEVRDFLDPAK